MTDDDIKRRLEDVEHDVKEILAWVNQQKGGRKALYVLMAASAGAGGAVTKGIEFLIRG